MKASPWETVFPSGTDNSPILPIANHRKSIALSPEMELKTVVAVIRHGDRTPKQKMKMFVSHQDFLDIFTRYKGFDKGKIKLKKPRELQEVLDVSRKRLSELSDEGNLEERKKLEQLRSVLEMNGLFSGINRKVQMKLMSKKHENVQKLLLIVKWGGELTPAGKIQAEQLGRAFRCMYPGEQGGMADFPGCGLLRNGYKNLKTNFPLV